jgi:hypothetical protein
MTLNETADVAHSLTATSTEQRQDLYCNIQPSTNFNGKIAVAEGYYVSDHEVTGGVEESLTAVADEPTSIHFESVAITEDVGEALLHRSISVSSLYVCFCAYACL